MMDYFVAVRSNFLELAELRDCCCSPSLSHSAIRGAVPNVCGRLKSELMSAGESQWEPKWRQWRPPGDRSIKCGGPSVERPSEARPSDSAEKGSFGRQFREQLSSVAPVLEGRVAIYSPGCLGRQLFTPVTSIGRAPLDGQMSVVIANRSFYQNTHRYVIPRTITTYA